MIGPLASSSQSPARRSLTLRPWLALGSGALSATGFAPLGLWPVTLACLALLTALIAGARSGRRAALIAWLFGVGHFAVGNNWIATAFTYQAQMPAALGWIAVLALALYLAVFPMLAGLAAWLLRAKLGGDRSRALDLGFVIAFAGTWIVAEWLRGWVFTGYPWNPLGVVALGGFDRPGLAGIARYVGTYGLSGLVILFVGLWTLALVRWGPRFDLARDPGRTGKLAAAAVIIAVPSALWLGAGAAPAGPMTNGRQAFTLVQPLIPQEQLNDAWFYPQHFARAAALSGSARPERRIVLWPESGVPDYLRPGYPRGAYVATTYRADPVAARQRLARVIGPQSVLLTGTADLEMTGRKVTGARNVVTALDGQGRIVGSYAKAHLVPYGEYLPLRAALEPIGLSRLVPGAIDFLPGPGPRTLNLGAYGKVGVQICYEIIFSGAVVDPANRPDFIFNPSNDGWFGAFGPPQHLAQARLRAIEEGLPVLRATTTGISAVIAPDGRVVASIGLGSAGRIDGRVPRALPPTLFAKHGNAIPLVLAALLLAISTVAIRRRRG